MKTVYMRFPEGKTKAFTMSYDDGTEQDIPLVAALNRYRIKATFNLNSGLFVKPGTTYPDGEVHRVLDTERAASLYAGHEIAVHTVSHCKPKRLSPQELIREIEDDRLALEKMYGGIIRGMAYPYGTHNEAIADACRLCGIVYSRTVQATMDFDIPVDFLHLDPTCHQTEENIGALADRFLHYTPTNDPWLFYVWGHSYEFDCGFAFSDLEHFLSVISNQPDVWYATNIEICDYVLAFRSLHYSADRSLVHNPTCQTVWLSCEGKLYSVAAGQTVTID